MARISKAALAASNVAVLPSAAPRKVNNNRYAAQRQAKRAHQEIEPWPGEHKWPHQRRQEEEIRLFAEMTRSPELLIVMTMFEIMGVDQQATLAAKVAGYAESMGDDASVVAALITKRLAKAGKWASEQAARNSEREGR